MLSMHILIWIAYSASKCVVTDGGNMRVIANGVNRFPVSIGRLSSPKNVLKKRFSFHMSGD